MLCRGLQFWVLISLLINSVSQGNDSLSPSLWEIPARLCPTLVLAAAAHADVDYVVSREAVERMAAHTPMNSQTRALLEDSLDRGGKWSLILEPLSIVNFFAEGYFGAPRVVTREANGLSQHTRTILYIWGNLLGFGGIYTCATDCELKQKLRTLAGLDPSMGDTLDLILEMASVTTLVAAALQLVNIPVYLQERSDLRSLKVVPLRALVKPDSLGLQELQKIASQWLNDPHAAAMIGTGIVGTRFRFSYEAWSLRTFLIRIDDKPQLLVHWDRNRTTKAEARRDRIPILIPK